VTGGAGFIGRYCVRSFLEKNYKVTIFDNFSNSSEDVVSDLLNYGANLVKGDITVQEQVSNALSGHGVVIHLAAKNSVEESIKFPEQTFNANVDGTKNILESCVKHNIKNLIVLKKNNELLHNPLNRYFVCNSHSSIFFCPKFSTS